MVRGLDGRASTRTSPPRARKAAAIAEPRKPLAPVTSAGERDEDAAAPSTAGQSPTPLTLPLRRKRKAFGGRKRGEGKNGAAALLSPRGGERQGEGPG